MFDYSHILGRYTHPSFFGGGMNLGGYQNNLGPWNMQHWQGGSMPWQGGPPGGNGQGPNPGWGGNPQPHGQFDPMNPFGYTRPQEGTLGSNDPSNGTSVAWPGNPAGTPGAEGGAGALPGDPTGGSRADWMNMFNQGGPGIFNNPHLSNLLSHLTGGGGNFNSVIGNMFGGQGAGNLQSPNFQSLVGNMFGGQGTSNPNPTVPTAPSPSAFTQGPQNNGR